MKHRRILAYLGDERPVFFARLEVLLPVLWVLDKVPAVHHRRVTQFGPVATTQYTPRQLTRVHHRGDDQARAFQGGPPKRVPIVFANTLITLWFGLVCPLGSGHFLTQGTTLLFVNTYDGPERYSESSRDLKK